MPVTKLNSKYGVGEARKDSNPRGLQPSQGEFNLQEGSACEAKAVNAKPDGGEVYKRYKKNSTCKREALVGQVT